MKIELIMAEFGEERKNMGGNVFDGSQRLDPTLTTFTNNMKSKHDLKLTLITDTEVSIDTPLPYRVEMITDNIFDNNSISSKGEQRHGNRSNDYYKVKGLLESDADIAICMDSDMYVVNEEFQTIVPLTQKFGMCIPENPRLQVRFDGIRGMDGNYTFDEDPTRGNGMITNMSPITLDTSNQDAKDLLKEYLNEMETNPARGPLSMWRAIWKRGWTPYVLPFQWCVCDMSVGINDVICLHTGHQKVADYYLENE